MSELTFKTNFKCQGCADKVIEEFKKNENVKNWSVDLTSPEKLLTVETLLSAEEIRKIIEKVGYKAEIK